MEEEPSVAIVGIACQLPGAKNCQQFWNLLKNSENHVQEVGNQRWDNEQCYNGVKNTVSDEASGIYSAGLVEDILKWDNQLFGVSLSEAESMDPQQKVAVETTYRAFEDAGFTLKHMDGSDAAVYMGVGGNDYSMLLGANTHSINEYSARGMASCMIANRVSQIFNLCGPSMTVDTGCSSGMMAVHLGARSILSGENQVAVCGGVSVILSPVPFIARDKATILSASGQSKVFSNKANGYTLGEGCGVVILKKLTKARADGDHIWGLMTTVCQSAGKATSASNLPSVDSQTTLLNMALKNARVTATQVEFVEMNGSATLEGDVDEGTAIGNTIGTARKSKRLPPCYIGCAKTNIGHTGAVSGLVSLIKLVLMMQYGEVVPSVLFDKLNDKLNLAKLNLDVALECKIWPVNMGDYRVACATSFAIGGTNICAVVKNSEVHPYNQNVDVNPQVVLFTGKDKRSLQDCLKDTAKAIEVGHIDSLYKLSYTSCYRRTAYSHRLALLGTSLKDLKLQIYKILDQPHKPIGRKFNGDSEDRNLVMVFSGIGSQWCGMGLDMYNSNKVFKETIDRLAVVFKNMGDFNLLHVLENLLGKTGVINPAYVEPAIFAIQAALYNAWRNLGVIPNAIVGHSIGEVAAAYASGRLSLKEAAAIAYYQGHFLGMVEPGKMLRVEDLDLDILLSEMQDQREPLDIAVFNGPKSFIVSGFDESIEKLEQTLKANHGKVASVKMLEHDIAYNSFCMTPIERELKAVIQRKLLNIDHGGTRIRHISTVTGVEATNGDFATPDYWWQNTRNSVKFSDALNLALEPEALNIVLEISPKPSLSQAIQANSVNLSTEFLPSLDEGNEEVFVDSYLRCFEHGVVQADENSLNTYSAFPRYAMQKQHSYKISNTASNFSHTEISHM